LKNTIKAAVAAPILALLVSASVGVTVAASATGGGDEPCVPTEGTPASNTPWVNSGEQVKTEDKVAPGTDTETERWLYVGETEPEVVTPAVEGQHYSLKGNSGIGKDEIPPTPDVNPDIWQANTSQEPNGHYGHHTQPDGSPYVEGEEGLHFASHGPQGEGLRDWFYFRAPKPAVTDVDYLWQKQTRTLIPAVPPVTCPDPETPTETPTTTPPVPTETPTVTPPVPTPTTPTETPSETPQPEPEQPEQPEPDKPGKPDKPDNTTVTECVDGVFVTTVDGEVISESGSCDESLKRATVYAQEEGL
jgi:hypothetical protein